MSTLNNSTNNSNSNLSQPSADSPNDSASKNDNNIVQENGQRKWGPPGDWTGPPPAKRGTEVFVGKLPRELTEQDLLPVLQQAGRVYELRLMIDFSGANRGYCFVTYASKEEAKSACESLNNYEIREGKHIGVVISIDNCRLFVGGIPRERNRSEILTEMSKLVEGVRDVILYPSANDKAKNRGFAFVEFETHKQAAQARRKLFPGRVHLWGQPICVDWAEPEQEVDDHTMATVKVLYVRNLMLSTSEEKIKEKFESVHPGSVERVKKIKDFAFVHFSERQHALDTMKALNGSNLEGAEMEVQLSKPPDKTIMRYVKNAQKGAGGIPVGSTGNPHQDIVAAAAQSYLQNHPHGLTNLALAPSGTIPVGNDPLTWAYTGSPLIHAPPGTPPIIPESIYGTGAVRHGHRGAAGMRGAGFQAHVTKQVRNARRRTSDQASLMYELYPYPTVGGFLWVPSGNGATGGTPVPHPPPLHPPPIQLSPTHINQPTPTKKASIQLEEYCRDRNWGKPVFETTPTVTKTMYGHDITLFGAKVTIPILAASVGSFHPNRSWADEEEAKEFAALYTLVQLTAPTFGGIDQASALYGAASGIIQSGLPTAPPVINTTNIH